MQLGLCIDLNRVRILQSGRIISFLFVHGLSIFCPVTRSGFERGKNTNPFIIPIINPISPFAPITRPDLTRSKQGWPDFFFSAPRVGLIIIYRCTILSVICTKALFYTSNQIDPREFTKELSRIAIRDHPSYPNQVLVKYEGQSSSISVMDMNLATEKVALFIRRGYRISRYKEVTKP